MASAQDRRELASNGIDSGDSDAVTRLQQPAGDMQSSALASGAAQEHKETEHVAAEGAASQSVDPAQQPVLVCS